VRWQAAMIARLAQVRELRMQLAERELEQADRALAWSREAERHAQQAVGDATVKRETAVLAADKLLLSGHAGGRTGISGWHTARKKASAEVRFAQDRASDAVSDRLEKDLECDAARQQWRDKRLNVERLRLLAEGLGDPPP
jgi:hypothetical protein